MRRHTGAGTVAALVLCCVFAVTMLLSLAAGAGVYRRVTSRVESSSQRRTGITYLVSKLHGHDQAAGVRAGSFGDGDAIFLDQELEGLPYVTVLYVCDGYLMELFCETAWMLEPEDGEQIAPAEALRVTAEDGALRLALTGAGGNTDSAVLALRGGEEW